MQLVPELRYFSVLMRPFSPHSCEDSSRGHLSCDAV